MVIACNLAGQSLRTQYEVSHTAGLTRAKPLAGAAVSRSRFTQLCTLSLYANYPESRHDATTKI